MYLPNEIKNIVKNLEFKLDNIGRSNDKVITFENTYVLKISNDVVSLKNEKMKIDWLSEKLPTAKSILFIEENNTAFYLRTYVKGNSLISVEYLENPNTLIKLIKEAFDILSNINASNCPFKSNDSLGKDFIHGDFCLPNILVDNNKIAGFIDLDNSGLGDKWYDISWLIWSFEYNLKTTVYTKKLLETLKIKMNYEKFNKYIPIEYRNKLN